MKYVSLIALITLFTSCSTEVSEREIECYVISNTNTNYALHKVKPYVSTRFGGYKHKLEGGILGNAMFIIVEHNEEIFAFYVPDEVWVGDLVTFTIAKRNNKYYLKNYKYESRTRI